MVSTATKSTSVDKVSFFSDSFKAEFEFQHFKMCNKFKYLLRFSFPSRHKVLEVKEEHVDVSVSTELSGLLPF